MVISYMVCLVLLDINYTKLVVSTRDELALSFDDKENSLF